MSWLAKGSFFSETIGRHNSTSKIYNKETPLSHLVITCSMTVLNSNMNNRRSGHDFLKSAYASKKKF